MAVENYLYNIIFSLRSYEEIILFDRIVQFMPEDESIVKDFLALEYENESLNFPYQAPPYDSEAALWATKIIYTACQLILYRKHNAEELPHLLPQFALDITPSAILSADLCLRFLPRIIEEAQVIDPEDKIIPLLQAIIVQWHYSGIGYVLKDKTYDFNDITQNKCLEQLYVDIVILQKDSTRAQNKIIYNLIKSTIGLHVDAYWKELKTIRVHESDEPAQ